MLNHFIHNFLLFKLIHFKTILYHLDKHKIHNFLFSLLIVQILKSKLEIVLMKIYYIIHFIKYQKFKIIKIKFYYQIILIWMKFIIKHKYFLNQKMYFRNCFYLLINFLLNLNPNRALCNFIIQIINLLILLAVLIIRFNIFTSN